MGGDRPVIQFREILERVRFDAASEGSSVESLRRWTPRNGNRATSLAMPFRRFQKIPQACGKKDDCKMLGGSHPD
jgi:hypothetical protein